MLVPGLRNTIALDFHLSQSALYWTDVVEDKIYRGKLSENGGEHDQSTFFVFFILVSITFYITWFISVDGFFNTLKNVVRRCERLQCVVEIRVLKCHTSQS